MENLKIPIFGDFIKSLGYNYLRIGINTILPIKSFMLCTLGFNQAFNAI